MNSPLRPSRPLCPLLLLCLVCLLGFLSMGYQLVASRMLGAWFGSSIIIWAYLISTFLFAFSVGSMLGGWFCRRQGPIRLRYLLFLSAGAALGFGIDTFASRPILDFVERTFESESVCLFLSCSALYILPIASISAIPPLCTEALAASGLRSGFATGMVYGISTVGNIAGVMVTAFFLIPTFPISTMLIFWLVVSVIEMALFTYLLTRPAEAPLAPLPAHHPEGVASYAHRS